MKIWIFNTAVIALLGSILFFYRDLFPLWCQSLGWFAAIVLSAYIALIEAAIRHHLRP